MLPLAKLGADISPNVYLVARAIQQEHRIPLLALTSSGASDRAPSAKALARHGVPTAEVLRLWQNKA